MQQAIFTITLLLFTSMVIYGQLGTPTPPNIETTFIEAELEKYLNNSDRQEEKLLECIEMDRRNPELQYQLARLYHEEGDNQKSLEFAQKAVSLDGSNKWYQLLIADVNELLLDYASANAALSKVSKMEPKNSVIQMRMAKNFEMNGSRSESISLLNKMQQTFGITDVTTFKLLELHNTKEDYSNGLTVLKAAVDAAPRNVDILNALANQYLLMKKDKDAEKIYRKVLSIDPENAVANSQIVRQNIGEAKDSEYLYAIKPMMENPSLSLDAKVIELIPYVEQLQTDDSPELKSALQGITEQLTNQYPDEAKAYSIRGDVMYLTGQLEPALKSYNKTISLNDAVFPVWAQKLNVLYELGKEKALIDFAEKAIDYYPNQFEGYFWYALGQYDAGDADEAADYLDEMSLVAGGTPLASKWGNILNALIGNSDKAAVNTLVETYDLEKSSDPLELHLVSRIYEKAGDSSKANTFAQKAVSNGYVGS